MRPVPPTHRRNSGWGDWGEGVEGPVLGLNYTLDLLVGASHRYVSGHIRSVWANSPSWSSQNYGQLAPWQWMNSPMSVQKSGATGVTRDTTTLKGKASQGLSSSPGQSNRWAGMSSGCFPLSNASSRTVSLGSGFHSQTDPVSSTFVTFVKVCWKFKLL